MTTTRIARKDCTENCQFLFDKIDQVNIKLRRGELDLYHDERCSRVYYASLEPFDTFMEIQIAPPIRWNEQENKFVDLMEPSKYREIYFDHLTIAVLIDLYIDKLVSIFGDSWDFSHGRYFELRKGKIEYNIKPNLSYGVVNLENTGRDKITDGLGYYAKVECLIAGKYRAKVYINEFDELEEAITTAFNSAKANAIKKLERIQRLELF